MLETLIFKRKGNIPKSDFAPLNKKVIIVIYLFFFVPILLDTLYLLHYIFSFDFQYYLKNRIFLRKGKGLFILISYMATVLIPILYADFIVRYRKTKYFFIKHTLFILTFVLPFIAVYILMGNRLTAFILILLLTMTYLIVSDTKIKLTNFLKLSIAGFLILVFFSLAGYFRSIQWNIQKANVAQFSELLNKELSHAIVKNFGNFEHLVWLIEYPHWDVLYGKTYIAGFLNLIPRAIWSQKPYGGGPHLKNIIHPGSYDINTEKISSYTTGVMVESYMNFKILGIVVIGFFHALFLIFLRHLAYKITNNIILLVIYLYLLLSGTFLILFGEFLGIFTRTFIIVIPFVVLYLYSRTIEKYSSRGHYEKDSA